MIEFIYQTLAKIGYSHPLHPTLTHLVMGLVIGGFVFALVAWLLRQPALAQTARHCMALALIALFPTALLGYMDWQYRFSGAWLFPIKMKLPLAGVLLIVMVLSVIVGLRSKTWTKNIVLLYALCLVSVIGLGYFGGELVYGKRALKTEIKKGPTGRGAILFAQKCSPCHYSDSKGMKVGPGLKGIFKAEKLPASGRAVTEANVRKQLKTPFKNMPPFAGLAEEEMTALLAYLRSL